MQIPLIYDADGDHLQIRLKWALIKTICEIHLDYEYIH